MKRTIAKMLHAHSNMTVAKLLSARLPLPRFLRKSRIADGAPSATGATGSGTNAAGGLGTIGGTGCDDLESRSSVIRVEDTIRCFLSVRSRGRLYRA